MGEAFAEQNAPKWDDLYEGCWSDSGGWEETQSAAGSDSPPRKWTEPKEPAMVCESASSSVPSQKIGFSFSIAKKAPVKLDSSAAVFHEANDDANESNEVTLSYKGKLSSLPEGAVEALAAEAAAEAAKAEEAKKVGYRTIWPKQEEETAVVMEYYYYTPPPHCKVKPRFPFMIFCKSTEKVILKADEGQSENKRSDCTKDGCENK
uniref:G patch domain-containing protein 8-like n=1 Tax=Myxine glutinosa TaxID=7769 RepID=UPI00358E447F